MYENQPCYCQNFADLWLYFMQIRNYEYLVTYWGKFYSCFLNLFLERFIELVRNIPTLYPSITKNKLKRKKQELTSKSHLSNYIC